jgi:hypothetical protein
MNRGKCSHDGDVKIEHHVEDSALIGRHVVVVVKCIECGERITFRGLQRVRRGPQAHASSDGKTAYLPICDGPDLRLFTG